jgi:hypothetical protein
MVPMIEIVFVVVSAALGLRWFRRTNLYRAHRSHGLTPGQQGQRAEFGMYQLPRPTLPPAALNGHERSRRRARFARRGH